MKRTFSTIVIGLSIIVMSVFSITAQGTSAGETIHPNFKLLVPEQAAGWGRMQYTDFADEEKQPPRITATYKNPDFPQEFKLELFYSEGKRRGLLQSLQTLTKRFGKEVVQTIDQGNSTMYVVQGQRGDRGFAGVIITAGAMTTRLSPNGSIDAADKNAIMNELQAIYQEFNINELADYYIPPVADASIVDAPEGFVPYATFLGNTHLAFAYPDGWSVVDFYNQGATQRDKLTIIKNLAAIKEANKKLDYNMLIKNFIAGFSGSDNILISVDRNGKWYKSEGYTPEIIKKIKKGFPGTFDKLTVQPPKKMSVDGHPAFNSVLKGSTLNGQDVVMKRIVIKIPKKAVYVVDIFRPENVSIGTENALKVFLESLTMSLRK